MYYKRGTKKSGFTLVELIVVIAIIAILTAVIVPSFGGFIERGRFSNDTQRAEQLTRILEAYAVEESLEAFDAYDIRALINESLGETYDFTPESRDTSFFYMKESNAIIIAKYDEVESITELSQKNQLLSGVLIDDSNDLSSPSELFGSDRLMLSETGSPLAEAVRFVNNMAQFGPNIQSKYNDLMTQVNQYDTGVIGELFGFGLSDVQKDKIKWLLEEFNPNENIFVNNIGWHTSATSSNTIKRVVFTPGISSIPKYNANPDIGVSFESVTLPITVKTIRNDAFPSSVFTSLNNVILKTSQAPIVEEDAFNDGVEMAGNDIITSEIALTDYSDFVSLSIDGSGHVTYDISDLPIRQSVSGYEFNVKGDIVTVMIYTKDGLVGYATNAYTVTFYLNADNSFYYYQIKTANSTFSTPPNPERNGYNFLGWFDNPDLEGDPVNWSDYDLPEGNKNVSFYAKTEVLSADLAFDVTAVNSFFINADGNWVNGITWTNPPTSPATEESIATDSRIILPDIQGQFSASNGKNYEFYYWWTGTESLWPGDTYRMVYSSSGTTTIYAVWLEVSS
jgi:prepilin-type N-terminal cleavage/methylation domain-containing protein